MYEYHKSFDTLIAVDLNKQLLEAMTGRLCDGSLPSRIGGRGVVQAGGGVIMVISFSFHPLCLLPLQRRSFTFSAQWMSSLRVLCDPRGKTLITPNCFNLISRQRANKKSKYRTKGNLYRGGAEPDKEIGALWCQPIKIQFKCKWNVALFSCLQFYHLGIGKNHFDFDLFSYRLIIFMRQNTFCA